MTFKKCRIQTKNAFGVRFLIVWTWRGEYVAKTLPDAIRICDESYAAWQYKLVVEQCGG